MQESAKENMAAAVPGAGNEGTGQAAGNVSPIVNKTVSTWQKIGRLERHGRGARLTFRDPFGAEHLLYISQRDMSRIIQDRAPGDVVRIDETPNELVISTEGRAFRSRTGRALMIRVPYCAGADIACPWKSFMAVIEGKQQAAPLSIMQTAGPAATPAQQHRGDISAGLAGGF